MGIIYWFSNQIDYIHFLTGVACISLAVAAWFFHREKQGDLAWIWLGFFGIVAGLREWQQIFSAGLPNELWLNYAGIILEMMSFLALFEFARRSMPGLGLYKVNSWVYALMFAVLCLGALQGLAKVHMYLHFFVGIPAFAGVVWVLWEYRRRQSDSLKMRLGVVAAASGALLVLWGFLVPEIEAFTSAMTLAYFQQAALDAGINALRCLAIFGWALFLELAFNQIQREKSRSWGVAFSGKVQHWLSISILGMLIAGWVATDWAGRQRNAEERFDILQRAKTAMVSINSQCVLHLSNTLADVGKSDYQILRKNLWDIQKISDDAERIYILNQRKGKIILAVDSEPEDTFGHEDPGTEVDDAPAELFPVFKLRKAAIVGPYTDRWGKHISAFIPITSESARTLGVLGMDIQASTWIGLIARSRLWPIGITLLLVFILLMYSLIHQRLQHASDMIASSELKYRSLVEGSPNCVFLLDQYGKVTTINQNGLRAFGLETLRPGSSFADFWPEKNKREIRGLLERALAGERVQLEHEYIRPDGRRIIWDGILNPMSDPGKPVRNVVGILRDNTARKITQEFLRQSEERFREMAENIQDGITVLENNRVVFVNERACDIFGYPREELLVMPGLAFLGPEELDRVEQYKQDVQTRDKTDLKLECWIAGKNGERRFIQNRHSFMRGEKHERVYIVTTDMTEQKKRQDNEQEIERRFKAVYEESNDAIMLLTEKGFFDCNQRTLELFGLKDKNRFINSHPADVSPEFQPGGQPSLAAVNARIQAAIQTGTQRFEWMHKRQNGENFLAEVVFSAYEFNGEKVVQATVRDITERKEAERNRAQCLSSIQMILETIPNPVFFKDALSDLTELLETFTRFLNEAKISPVTESRIKELTAAADEEDVAYLRTEIPKALKQSLDCFERISTIIRSMKEFAHPGEETARHGAGPSHKGDNIHDQS
jgi:PAS domain S-box-containing protein